MTSRKEQKVERKKSEKEFLDKYKETAPKGPGFTWKGKLIFGTIFLIFVFGFVYGKTMYIGRTPMTLIDYSLTQSLNFNGRDIDLKIENDDETILDTNLKYTFKYLTTAGIIQNENHGPLEFYITGDDLSYRSKNGSWNQYKYDNADAKIDYSLFKPVLSLNSIPDKKDIFKDSVQFFATEFYKRFTFGNKQIITTSDNSYNCKQINLNVKSTEFYPILNDLLYFSSNNLKIREAMKDRIEKFIIIVHDNELYDEFNLDEETVNSLIDDFDYYYEVLYYQIEDSLTERIDNLEDLLNDLNSEVNLSFFIDKKFNIRAVDIKYIDHDKSNTVNINYIVNDFTYSYVESPLGADTPNEITDLNIILNSIRELFQQ